MVSNSANRTDILVILQWFGNKMEGKNFIFISGLHRSGTSLLHEIIRSHPEVSGFQNTGVPKDEGQHLQTVFEPAASFGGPGRFAFDSRSGMDESHSLATSANARTIFNQWRPHYDMSRKFLVEKSPPNIVRTRFLQKLFPESKFIFLLRHPVAVSYATRKWSRTSIHSLLEHYLLAHEIMLRDIQLLHSAYILKYEELVADPQAVMRGVFHFLGLSPVEIHHELKRNVNDKYFQIWESEKQDSANSELNRISQQFEIKVNYYGYSIENYHNNIPMPWLGAHVSPAPGTC